MKYIVYLTTNLKSLVNNINRIYVGVHKTNDPEIFDGYIGCGVHINQPSTYKYPKTPFQHAVKKYGVNAFKREILFIYDTAEEAYKKESEIVDKDFIKQSHVYNATLGGLCTKLNKHLYQFDKAGKLIKEWDYSNEAYEFYGYDQNKFYFAINGKYLFLDSFWSFNDKININEYSTNKHGKPKIVYLYDKNGKLVNEFESQKRCSDYLGLKSIDKALLNQLLINNSYYVSNKLVDLFIPKPRLELMNETYFIYKDKKFIGKFVGKEIMKIINLYSWSSIRDIFRYNQSWYKDFYLSFEEIKEVPDKIYKNKISVDVYDKFGNFIETLSTVKEVKEKYKVPSSKIKNIQMGDKYFGDYIFKYSK